VRRSSLATAAAGLAASLLVSAVGYLVFETVLLFLFVPFVPVLLRSSRNRPTERVCPACGFRTRDPDVAYCPRDGTELDEGE
jgi:hypothetical protein